MNFNPNNLPQMLRMSELASDKGKQGFLPFSHSTIRRWEADGQFPKHKKIGKCRIYMLSDVIAWVQQYETAPQPDNNQTSQNVDMTE